jgi:hypothetical protein
MALLPFYEEDVRIIDMERQLREKVCNRFQCIRKAVEENDAHYLDPVNAPRVDWDDSQRIRDVHGSETKIPAADVRPGSDHPHHAPPDHSQ